MGPEDSSGDRTKYMVGMGHGTFTKAQKTHLLQATHQDSNRVSFRFWVFADPTDTLVLGWGGHAAKLAMAADPL